MSKVDDFLQRHGAFGTDLDTLLHRGTFSGWRRCRCPKCSDNRKNKADRCLGVRHPEEGTSMSYATTVDGEAGLSPEGVKHLQERGLSDTTAKALGVYESSSRSSRCLVFPYLKDGKVVNNKYRTFDKKFSTDAGGEQVAWNRQCLQDPTLMKEPLIITEGELDALTAIQCGLRGPSRVRSAHRPRVLTLTVMMSATNTLLLGTCYHCLRNVLKSFSRWTAMAMGRFCVMTWLFGLAAPAASSFSIRRDARI